MKKIVNGLALALSLFVCLSAAGCTNRPPLADSLPESSPISQSEEPQSAEIVHEGESVQIIRAMMNLDYASMTVQAFNETIQAMCAEAGTTVFEVISDAYDHFGVYDDTDAFVATVFSDPDLEEFIETTLAYSAQELFGEPVHLDSIVYMTMPGFTAKEQYQKKEQMPFAEWNAFFEEHIAEINVFPALFYSIETDIVNPDTLLVADRDGKINDAQASVIRFFLELDEEAVKAPNIEDTLALELERISTVQSDTRMSITCSIQGLERDISG